MDLWTLTGKALVKKSARLLEPFRQVTWSCCCVARSLIQ